MKEEANIPTRKIILFLVNGAEKEDRIEIPSYLNEFNLQQLLGEKSTSMGTIQAMSLQVWGTKT